MTKKQHSDKRETFAFQPSTDSRYGSLQGYGLHHQNPFLPYANSGYNDLNRSFMMPFRSYSEQIPFRQNDYNFNNQMEISTKIVQKSKQQMKNSPQSNEVVLHRQLKKYKPSDLLAAYSSDIEKILCSQVYCSKEQAKKQVKFIEKPQKQPLHQSSVIAEDQKLQVQQRLLSRQNQLAKISSNIPMSIKSNKTATQLSNPSLHRDKATNIPKFIINLFLRNYPKDFQKEHLQHLKVYHQDQTRSRTRFDLVQIFGAKIYDDQMRQGEEEEQIDEFNQHDLQVQGSLSQKKKSAESPENQEKGSNSNNELQISEMKGKSDRALQNYLNRAALLRILNNNYQNILTNQHISNKKTYLLYCKKFILRLRNPHLIDRLQIN